MRRHQLPPVGRVIWRSVCEPGPPRAAVREQAAAHGVLTRSTPKYQRLSEKGKKAVRELVDEELKRYRARVSIADRLGRFRGERAAQVPDWMPAELPRTELETQP